jgi:glycosyltransferase involved in cell wall biosynthesis
VYVEPVFVGVPIPEDVAQLLTKHLQAPFDLVIQHGDPDNLGISQVAAECSTVRVGWSMWEFSDGRPLANRVSSFAKRLRYFDLMLMYDQVAVDAWQKYGPKRQVWGVLQGGYEASEWKYFEGRDWFGDRFMFIMNGQLHARKAPYVTIQAFNELKHEHKEFDSARLGLHTTIGDPLVVFGDLIPGMKVWHEVWEKDIMLQFYHAAHVLVAPSRGEGKNLPALEMMSTGGAVAATSWGGHMQWMNGEYAYPLDYTLTPTDPAHPDAAHDAKVGVETVKQMMWHTFNNRGEVKQKAELAARMIPQLCDWDRVMEKFFDRVRDLVPGKGEELWLQAQQCRNRE